MERMMRNPLLLLLVTRIEAQVAPPVWPIYNFSLLVAQLFNFPLVQDHHSVEELLQRKAVQVHNNACLINAKQPTHSTNKAIESVNITELRADPTYLDKTTYWVNDYLHVGHVHYDIVQIQILKLLKVDRIIMQRPACHGTLCVGIGSVDSFYKGYYAAMFEAFNQHNIPVYLRWSWTDKHVQPLFFSSRTKDFYLNSTEHIDPEYKKPILLQHKMCFERVIRRADTDYGRIPTVSAGAIQNFKAAAYRMIPVGNPPLTTYFEAGPPYRILFSYRGPRASRRISNMEYFISHLRQEFPEPDYRLRLMNNSDPQLDFQTQLQAVAESHVVITNHGAFEGNMIYMKNSSLLIEIFGHYGNNEIHTFHRLAIMFGVFYARVHPKDLTDHLAQEYKLNGSDVTEIVNIAKEYFSLKPFLLNGKPH